MKVEKLSEKLLFGTQMTAIKLGWDSRTLAGFILFRFFRGRSRVPVRFRSMLDRISLRVDDSAFLICQNFARIGQVILLYMRCRNSPGCSFIPLTFMIYILTYFNVNMLYRIFNIISKNQFSTYYLGFICNFQVL